MKVEKRRRLVSIMFTDIVGYTALMQKNEQAAARVRDRHRRVFDQQHKLYQGKILQYFGDGTLSIFESAVESIECAIAIQKELQEGEAIPLRIGLHLGDIVIANTDVYGDGVNLAARIESMGVAGAILLSKSLNDELKNHLHINTTSLGEFGLKNIKQPVEVFAVTNDNIVVPDRSALKGKQSELTKTIAVLPFVNMSPNAENEYFSDGMTEEIINALAKIKGLKVTSRTSSFFFKNKKIPIPQVGKELNVSTILEGSVRLSGNKMRITAQLIDVNEDYHFWSETFDRSVEDIFAVQDEISLLIADKLREHIGHLDIDEHLVDAPEVPVNIYKRYLQSRFHILKMSKADIDKGLSILKQIIAEQPQFPQAYLGMHLGYTLLGTIGLMPAHEAFTKGQPFLDKAIELNENLHEAQLHLSYISFLQKWDLPQTYKHLQKALDIRPTVEYYQSMASTLVAEGKHSAALHYMETAMQLDPFSSINYHLKGFIHYASEQYPAAIECFKKSRAMEPNFSAPLLYTGQSLLLNGQKKEGLQFFQNLPDEASGELIKTGGTTLSYIALGEIEKAKAGITQLEAALQTDLMERATNLLILCYTLIGQHDVAIRLIEQGIQHRLPLLVYIGVEPLLKPLRSSTRFQQLMQEILGDKTDIDFSNRKYKQSLFDKDLLQKHQQQLLLLMAEEQPYLDPNLTLRSLAQMMNLPPNHLSQLLNEGLNKNFAEFVNTYRLETFKTKVTDPSQQHLTILALAYDSGFNSKTVFNTFFKKTMGKTPRTYWKEVVK